VRVGRLLRVPRVELEKLIGGTITWPLPGPTSAPGECLAAATTPAVTTSCASAMPALEPSFVDVPIRPAGCSPQR